jgi:ATP-dependent DNA ligase
MIRDDWSDRYPAVLAAVMALKINSWLIDGEVAICDERGVAVFDRLRHGPRVKPEAVLFAFDLLELDGEDLRGTPIEVRKRKLARLVENCVLLSLSCSLNFEERRYGFDPSRDCGAPYKCAWQSCCESMECLASRRSASSV